LGNDDLEQGRGPAIKQPTIIDRAAFSQGPNAQYESRIETGETMSCLVARGPHAVAQPIPIHDQATRFNGKRGNKQDGKGNGLGIGQEYDPSPTLTKGDRHAVAQPIAFEPGKMQRLGYGYSDNGTSPTLRSEPGDNQLAVAQPIAFKVRGGCEGGGKGYLGQEDQAFTISATQDQQIAQPLYYESHPNDSRVNGPKDVADTVSARYGTGGGNTPLVQQPMAIRRLTPKECERLQGFPDDWTKIPYRNKPADQCPDGPRYKACGNSMAVPVMRWIGERINLIESML
jgi:site-specific DNA-cytosine methylase